MAIEIKAPTFPESVADGTVATWHKKVGEAVKRDELIVDIETDKVVIEVLAEADGVLAEIVKNELKGLGCKIVAEPGRLIVGNAGILVTEVIYVKDGGEKTFVIVDAAMNDLVRPTLYEAWHEIGPVVISAANAPRIRADVVGHLPEPARSFFEEEAVAPDARLPGAAKRHRPLHRGLELLLLGRDRLAHVRVHVGDEDVEPPVVIIIEQGDSAAHCFDQVFMRRRRSEMAERDPALRRRIGKCDWRRRLRRGRRRSARMRDLLA